MFNTCASLLTSPLSSRSHWKCKWWCSTQRIFFFRCPKKTSRIKAFFFLMTHPSPFICFDLTSSSKLYLTDLNLKIKFLQVKRQYNPPSVLFQIKLFFFILFFVCWQTNKNYVITLWSASLWLRLVGDGAKNEESWMASRWILWFSSCGSLSPPENSREIHCGPWLTGN